MKKRKARVPLPVTQRRFSPRLAEAKAKARMDNSPTSVNSSNQIVQSERTVVNEFRLESEESSFTSSSCSSGDLYAPADFIGMLLPPAEAHPLTAPTYAQGGGNVSDQNALAAKGIGFLPMLLPPAEADPLTSPTYAQGGGNVSDQNAVAAKHIGFGGAGITMASNNTSRGQEALEEARVISAVKEMPNDEPQTSNSSIGLSEMANMFADDDCGEDELQSFLSDPALVSVHGYRVKEISAPTVRAIIEKHGDIAMNCILETVESRSFFLEKVCEIIQPLQTMKYVDITEVEVKSMLSVVADLRIVNMNIGWLQRRLEEILEVLVMLRQYPKVKEQTERNAQIIEEAKKALTRLDAQISAEKGKMEAAEAENKSAAVRVSNVKDKLNRFRKESLLHDLF